MGATWFTADTHLGHNFVASLRGYDTSAAHDDALARAWDRVVGDRDEVWHLGDVALGGWRDRLAWFADRPGTKHLVLGNHDRAHPLNRSGHNYITDFEAVFSSVQTQAMIPIGGGIRAMLSHFPHEGDHGADRFAEWRLRDCGVVLIHGHTHGCEKSSRTSAGTLQIHVGLDAWKMRLVSNAQVLALATA